jgi:hypothetical protein
VPNHPSKPCSDCASWEIVESLHHVVLNAIKNTILALNFFSISTNQVIWPITIVGILFIGIW